MSMQGEIKQEDIPYMQRLLSAWDDSDMKNEEAMKI
jgi:hypothetical protein